MSRGSQNVVIGVLFVLGFIVLVIVINVISYVSNNNQPPPCSGSYIAAQIGDCR